MAPASHPAIAAGRAVVSFTIEGLPQRDEMLFRSLVRVLDHRTQQHWAWTAASPELRVVGIQGEGASGPSVDEAVPVLTIGEIAPRHGGHFLALPLHADQLEQVLNKLGAMVVHARGLGFGLREEPVTEVEVLRLLRWPPAALLEAPARIRLATLMTGRPTSLGLLQQRSGLSTQDCLEFLADLGRYGLLERASAVSVQAASPSTGGEGAALTDSLLPSPASPVREIVHQGLLARIRTRLGLVPGRK